MKPMRYPRDMVGHGPAPPDAAWPGGAKIAVQFVVNYEEGGESCLLHGDPTSEAFLTDVVGAANWPGQRHWNVETMYEYGARAGFWRLHRLFTSAGVPVTVFGVATALARGPEQVAAMKEAGWEIASHGLKWLEYKDFSVAEEKAHMAKAVQLHTEVVGERPRGWYTGRCSANTVRLAAEEGGFDWVSDSYADDLPYWTRCGSRDQLVIPYTLDANDARFIGAQGFSNGEDFFQYLKDTFDVLYEEGEAGTPKMMSVGLHCRLVGRPGRTAGLKRFLSYARAQEGVWFARRGDIARHWSAAHPPRPGPRPSEMDRNEFLAAYGEVFKQASWAAEGAFDDELGPAHDRADGLHSALARVFRRAAPNQRLAALQALPNLATAEQLEGLSSEESEAFNRSCDDYAQKFGFPFIIAVPDHNKAEILKAVGQRLCNEPEQELMEACRQLERVAAHRLRDLLP